MKRRMPFMTWFGWLHCQTRMLGLPACLAARLSSGTVPACREEPLWDKLQHDRGLRSSAAFRLVQQERQGGLGRRATTGLER